MLDIDKLKILKFLKYERESQLNSYDMPYLMYLVPVYLLFDMAAAFHAYAAYTSYGASHSTVVSFIVMVVSLLPYVAFLVIFTRILKLQFSPKRYILLAVNQVYFGCFMFMINIILSGYFDPSYFSVTIVSIGVVLLSAIKIVYTYLMFTRDLYKSKWNSWGTKFSNILAIPISVFVPLALSRTNENLVWLVIEAVIIWGVAYCLWGTVHLLKYHFVKKNNFNLEEIDRVQDWEKKKPKKKKRTMKRT